jgi:hypothetical protein
MSNVLDYEKQQQILALGRLGWTVSRIADATDVRRETATRHLRAAGLAVRARGRPGEAAAKPAISCEVSTRPARKTGNFPIGGVHRLCSESCAVGERV